MRLFVAAHLDEPTRARVAAVQARVRELCAGWRASWTREDGFHLTLKFLGEVGAARTGEIARALATLGESHRAIEVTFRGVGSFPPRGPARVVWLGVENGAAELTAVAADVDRRLGALGFPTEARGYSPHLTLARVRDPKRRLPPGLPPDSVTGRIETICLYESVLGAGPAKYTMISRVALPLSVENASQRP